MNRPLHVASSRRVAAGRASAGLALWRAMANSPLAAGIAGGAVAGLARRARAGVAVAGAATPWRRSAPVAAGRAGRASSPSPGSSSSPATSASSTRLGTAVVTFLVDRPAGRRARRSRRRPVRRGRSGRDDRHVGRAAAAARWSSVAAPCRRRCVGAALFAAPVGVPWWVPALFAVVVGVLLVVVSREHYTDMEPLVGTSTAIRRQLPWWRPAVTGVLAVRRRPRRRWRSRCPAPFDVRQFVDPDVVRRRGREPAGDRGPPAAATRRRRPRAST